MTTNHQPEFTIRIIENQSGNPPGKLADVEIQHHAGPYAGLKLIGFAVWERRTGTGRNVTFPARQYSVNGERRSFALLRPTTDSTAQNRIRDLILEAYAAHEQLRDAGQRNPESLIAPRPAPELAQPAASFSSEQERAAIDARLASSNERADDINAAIGQALDKINQEKAAQAAQAETKIPISAYGPERNLECCVCGNGAGRWHQWWNRDTDYGICRSCVDDQIQRGTPADAIRDYYGYEGVNYAGKPEQPLAQADRCTCPMYPVVIGADCPIADHHPNRQQPAAQAEPTPAQAPQPQFEF